MGLLIERMVQKVQRITAVQNGVAVEYGFMTRLAMPYLLIV